MIILESIEKESVQNVTLYILATGNTLLTYTTNIPTNRFNK